MIGGHNADNTGFSRIAYFGPMNMRCRFSLLFMLLLFRPALADGFDTFGKQQDLKANIIVEAGDVEKLEPPYGRTWSVDVLKLSGRCFKPLFPLSGYWGLGKKAGLLLVNQSGSYQIAFLESGTGSVKVDVTPVSVIDCPSLSSQDPAQRDTETIIEEIKRRQEWLNRGLDRNKSQSQ